MAEQRLSGYERSSWNGNAGRIRPSSQKAYLESIRTFKRGEPLAPERIPNTVYTVSKPKKDGSWRDLTIFGLWLLSERYAEVFRDFDMGLGGLYPIDVMLRDQVTPVGGNYFIFSAGSTKDALVVEKSEGLMKWFALEKPGWAPQLPSDDRIVLSQAALEGPEVWADTRLAQAFFFSDHLVRAMRKAKIATKFRLFQCRIE